LTAGHLIIQPRPAIELGLLAQYFPGYTVGLPGVLMGFFWGFVVGFCAGGFVAFTRNLIVASGLFVTRTELEPP
jgi:hypothetical protein